MIVVYDSLTGQTERFAKSLGFQCYSILDIWNVPIGDNKIFLITRSFNFGEIPETTVEFLDSFANLTIGVAVSGNKNWGTNYGAAGYKIEDIYGIPLISIFEMSGTSEDRNKIIDYLKSH